MKQRVLGRPPVALVSSFTRDTTDQVRPGREFERLRGMAPVCEFQRREPHVLVTHEEWQP